MSQEDFVAAVGRMNERHAAQMDTLLERIEDRLGRMEARVGDRLDSVNRDAQREFKETRRDLGELRDLVSKQGGRIDMIEANRNAQAAATAEGAARGAGQAAGLVAAAAARTTAAEAAKRFWSTWSVRIIAGCAGFSTILLAIKDLPGFLRGWDVFWTVVKSWK